MLAVLFHVDHKAAGRKPARSASRATVTGKGCLLRILCENRLSTITGPRMITLGTRAKLKSTQKKVSVWKGTSCIGSCFLPRKSFSNFRPLYPVVRAEVRVVLAT